MQGECIPDEVSVLVCSMLFSGYPLRTAPTAALSPGGKRLRCRLNMEPAGVVIPPFLSYLRLMGVSTKQHSQFGLYHGHKQRPAAPYGNNNEN